MARHCGSILRSSRRRCAAAGLAAVIAVGAMGMMLGAAGVLAQQVLPNHNPPLVHCGSTISFEKRLLMERWAMPGDCARPIRARIIDQFLGYTCVSESGVDVCRAFVPGLASRAFDTAQGFRCVDVALTETDDGGVAVSRMREWAAAPRQCEWDPSLGLLATEVDFDNGQVCVAGSCISADRLTAIGRVRLKYLVITAFRESGLIAQADRPLPLSPVGAMPR